MSQVYISQFILVAAIAISSCATTQVMPEGTGINQVNLETSNHTTFAILQFHTIAQCAHRDKCRSNNHY